MLVSDFVHHEQQARVFENNGFFVTYSLGVVGRTKQDTEARLEIAKKQAGDIYEDSKKKVDAHSKDVAAAKDSLIDTTKKEASNVSGSVRDAASHIAGEADSLYGQAKKVVNDEKEWIKKEYEHTKHTLGQEKEDIKREADRFAAEHHLKEGDTPTDIVVAKSRGERNELAEEIKHSYDQTKGKVLSEKERLEREARGIYDKAVGEKDRLAQQAKGSYNEAKDQAKGSYYEAKGQAKESIDETKKEATGFWASLTGKAQEKKAEAEKSAHDVYNKAVNEKDHLENQAKSTYNEAKQQASGLWSDVKGSAEQKKREAEHKSDELYNKAVNKKNEFERAGRQAADEAKGTYYNAKGEAEQKAHEAKWRAQSDADYVKAMAEGKKNEAASTLGSIINATKEKINDTFDTREDGRRPAEVVVAEERPIVA
jgi:uncharacterized protein YjbJ (UPF0337 family)